MFWVGTMIFNEKRVYKRQSMPKYGDLNERPSQAHKTQNDDQNFDHPLWGIYTDEIASRLLWVKKTFHRVLILGPFPPSKIPNLSEHAIIITDGDVDFLPSVLPFGPHQFDLIISFFHMHMINDVPGYLAQIQFSLNFEGVFIGACFGGTSLCEFQKKITQIEIDVCGGAAARIHPMISAKDTGSLLQRAQFQSPVSDAKKHVIEYTSLKTLHTDLKTFHQINGLVDKAPLSRDVYKILKTKFPMDITVESIYMLGWKTSINEIKLTESFKMQQKIKNN